MYYVIQHLPRLILRLHFATDVHASTKCATVGARTHWYTEVDEVDRGAD